MSTILIKVTLHDWERSGLLTPSLVTPAGHRFYDPADVQRMAESMKPKVSTP